MRITRRPLMQIVLNIALGGIPTIFAEQQGSHDASHSVRSSECSSYIVISAHDTVHHSVKFKHHTIVAFRREL